MSSSGATRWKGKASQFSLLKLKYSIRTEWFVLISSLFWWHIGVCGEIRKTKGGSCRMVIGGCGWIVLLSSLLISCTPETKGLYYHTTGTMNPPTTTPAVQYTSQMVAIEDSHCERSSCRKLIQKGQPRLYVRNHIEGNSGRYVCEGCFAVYSARSKTTVRVREVTVARGDSGALESYPQIRISS